MNVVAKYYQDNYNEDSRLSTNQARKVEFFTTVNILNCLIQQNSKILDVGAGTGIYSFYFAERGHNVTAGDITPKHVEHMRNKIKKDNIQGITAEIVDGKDLSRFETESFDVVFCFGPLYHLISLEDRLKAVSECLRVLKKGGLLALAYINKFYVFTRLVQDDKKFLSENLIHKIIDEGFISSADEDCFWTDAYFHTPEEIEKMMQDFGVEKLENVGVDGISTLLTKVIDNMNTDEYENWLKYHYKTCREPSLLGYSNHGLYVCRK